MRYDMHEVVIEKPRSGMRYRYRGKSLFRGPLEDLPTKQGMRRPWVLSGEWKSFNDLLGPLRGFLISRVGRKWDDVYSEIRQRLNPNSTVQVHILSHVYQFVERYAQFDKDGELSSIGRYGYSRGLSSGEMYVHPTTGILCRIPETKGWWKRNKKVEDNKKKIGDKEVQRIDGIWYWINTVEELVPLTNQSGEIVGNAAQFRVEKRQINKQDLRRHNLSNVH